MRRNNPAGWVILLILIGGAIIFLNNSQISKTGAGTGLQDTDLDGIPDSEDEHPLDFDNDGMTDIWEKKHGLRYDVDDAKRDPDNDGISNIDEFKQGTNPLISDKQGSSAVPVQPALLTPVENTLMRTLIWAIAILIVVVIVVFVAYRTHIFNMLKFAHHVSKKHAESQTSSQQRVQQFQRMPAAQPQRRYIPQQARQQTSQSHIQQHSHENHPEQSRHPETAARDEFVTLDKLKKKQDKQDVFSKLKHIHKDAEYSEDALEKLSKLR